MNPAAYTAKSLAGPVLFVIAAYWYGQSVGRRSATMRKLSAFTSTLPLGRLIHDDNTNPLTVWRLQNKHGVGPYEYDPSDGRSTESWLIWEQYNQLSPADRRKADGERARKLRSKPSPDMDFTEWAEIKIDPRLRYAFLRPEDAVSWFGTINLSLIERAGFNLTPVAASKAYLSKSKKQVLFVPSNAPMSKLSALPKTGRIPLATAKRALKSLGRKAKTCGITVTSLRDGMEVEREHRDVTRGGVLKTAKIAAAHICEDQRYYPELKKLERKLKRGK